MVWVIVLMVLILILWLVKECRNLHQFSYEGHIQELQSPNRVVIQESLKSKNPLLIHNVPLQTVELSEIVDTHPGYILHEASRYTLLDKFKDEDTMAIYRSSTLSEDLGYSAHLRALGRDFETSLSCGTRTTLSLHKGFHTVPLMKHIHNVTLYAILSGTAIVYLINPKHENEIHEPRSEERLNSDKGLNHRFKKWSHKIVLQPGLLLSVPSQWLLFYECKGSTVIGTYESDTYPTYLYNRLR